MTIKTWQLKTYGMRQKEFQGKFIAIKSYFKKQEKHWIDSLALHLKQLEKEEQQPKTKHKQTISRRKEIIKIRAEINEKEMNEIIVKTNKTKNLSFEKIKIDKPLARLIKKKEKKQINKIRNE